MMMVSLIKGPRQHKHNAGVAFTEFAITAPLIIFLTLFCLDVVLFFSLRVAAYMVTNEVSSFGLGNRHLKHSQFTPLNEHGLESYIIAQLNRYSLVTIGADQLNLSLTSSGIYPSLESESASPSDPFLDTNNDGTHTANEFWLDQTETSAWSDTSTAPYGIYNGSAVVSSLRIEITRPWTFGLGIVADPTITIRIPVANVSRM